jgi:hypothetical protein
MSGTFADAVASKLDGTTFTSSANLNTATALGYMAYTQGKIPADAYQYPVQTPTYGVNQGIALGASNSADAPTARGYMQLSLANHVLNNVDGDDIIVSESGSSGAPEGYMVRVSTDSTNFTSWQYRHAEVGYGSMEFLTGFDFVSDFGLAKTATVKMVEIANCIATDKVNSSTGEGTVVFSGDSGYSTASTLTVGSLNSTATLSSTGGGGPDVTYSANHFDADPCYVFYGSATAVATPEPSSIVLLVIGSLSALAWAIKRRKATV